MASQQQEDLVDHDQIKQSQDGTKRMKPSPENSDAHSKNESQDVEMQKENGE